MRRMLRELRVEIIAFLFVVLGVFLLTEQLELRSIIFRFLLQMSSAITRLLTTGVSGLVNRVFSIRPSDLLGLGLIGLALLILTWRVRWRLMHSEVWTGETCPLCGSSLHRAHRRPPDRLIDLFVPVRRYRCKNPECGWSGIRVKQATWPPKQSHT